MPRAVKSEASGGRSAWRTLSILAATALAALILLYPRMLARDASEIRFFPLVLMLFGMSIAWVWGFGFEPRNQWGRRVCSPWMAWGLMLLGAFLTFGR